MRSLCFTGLALLSLAGCSIETPKVKDLSAPTVKSADFQIIAGDDWTGTLTYLDYGSEKRVTIPTKAAVHIASSKSIKYSISYPEEPWEDTKAKLKLSKSGRTVDGQMESSQYVPHIKAKTIICQH